jgi:hypothetical protein
MDVVVANELHTRASKVTLVLKDMKASAHSSGSSSSSGTSSSTASTSSDAKQSSAHSHSIEQESDTVLIFERKASTNTAQTTSSTSDKSSVSSSHVYSGECELEDPVCRTLGEIHDAFVRTDGQVIPPKRTLTA